VVPVINLEWIQKLHRDRAARGYSTEAVSDTILRRMPDYVHYIIPQFAQTHINFQRVPIVDTSNSRFWEPAVKRYVDECMAGKSGPRGKDFNMRWIASLVAEAHRILMRGGVFLYPRDEREQGRSGRLRLLYEANPIGMVIEQAGGRASTGYGPVLEVEPARLHQKSGFVFGARHEVERIEQYHRDHNQKPYDAPLFGTRGLFRAAH